jgi:ribosome-associated protein
MDIRKLQRVIVDGLEDVKAQNIVVFNTEHLSSLFERVIVASGTSNRQTKSLAASVRDAVRAAGAPPPRTEGEANGEWIIVDCGAAVVHVMQPAIREYYHLEELWGDKPVKMKIDSAVPRLVKAASPVRDSAASREAGKPRAAAKRAAPAPRAAPAKRAAVGRATPSKRVVRTVGGKSGAVKTSRSGVRPAAKRAAPKR